MNLNKAILVGRVTQDIEINKLPNGNDVANFSVATNREWKNEQGEKQEKGTFHNIVAYGKVATVLKTYVVKGQELLVEGYLETRSWEDKDTGKKMYRTEIILQNFQFGMKPKNSTPATTTNNEQKVNDVEHHDDDINPEDIPF